MNFDPHFIITIIFAFTSGLIPTLVWLLFWMSEDKKNPEPKSMIALAFIGGMVAVFVSLFLEKYLYGLGLKNLFYTGFLKEILSWFDVLSKQSGVFLDKVLLVVVFAPIIEELSKFIMAYVLVLRSQADDEPLDPMIYMITTALGFAAIENMLFLINPFENHDVILSIFTGNMRFIGATLLHTVSSATIALFISFNFFTSRLKKLIFTLLGIVCSIIMHGVFNFFMIGNQEASIMALELIWIAVIIILLAIEKIKKIRLEKIY
ncbi:MAG: PrsW family glutamic-type intramembrane protease [Candidatus Paceibacterota bacterium]|jgi:RsiW-degrading membrane proteinase PrsW (M82 family)